MSLTYDDFDLQIERAGEKYRVRLLNAPTGQAAGEFILPFSDVELGNFLSRIGQVRRSMRRTDAPELQAAKEFGGRLFSAIFSGEMIAQLRGSMEQSLGADHGLRIRLRLTDVPELADLPWEFLYDASQNHFLTTSSETPVVRFLDLPQKIAPLRATLPLRVLVVIAGPRNLKRLDADGEWERLQESLGALVDGGHLVLERLPEATIDALRLRARGTPFHVLHFIGHGGFDSIAEDGVLQFEDESGMSYPVRGEMIGMLLHDHRSLRLAVLNACEGARSSRKDPFSGVAQSLLQQRVPAVIAMQFEISDIAAKIFAREFYRAIAEGNPVDAAMCESRKALFREEYGQEWATPVLYMRSHEGLLFDLQPGGATIVPGSGERVAVKIDSRERQAAETARVAQEAEAQRAAARHAEAEQVAAAERERLERERAERGRVEAVVDAEAQAAALTGSGHASRVQDSSAAAASREQTRRPPAMTSPGSGAAAAAQIPSAMPTGPTRSHLPMWQILLLTIPVAVLVLALSWHHLRPHSDDDHGEHGVPAAQSSVAATSPRVTPSADQAPATAQPAKAVDNMSAPGPAPETKMKGASTHIAIDTGKAPVKSAAAAAAATLAASPVSTAPAPSPAVSQPAANTPPAPVAPKRVRVDAAQQLSKLVDRVNPTYPMASRQAQVSGAVRVGIVVGKDGKVLSTAPVSGDALLLQSAMDAVKQWRYQPTLVNGEPVEVESTVEVDYKLNPPPAAAKPVLCTLGKVDFQDQGAMLIGSVPYTYSGTADLQTLAVRGVPLNASKQPIAGASIAQSTLKAANGTASFSIQGHPSMGKSATDGEYVLVAIVVKTSSEVVCGEAVPYRHKW